MEIPGGIPQTTFGDLHRHLLDLVRARVANGELTESRLARLTGVSQPHIHNVLKGVRILSTDLADEIIAQLRINFGELSGHDYSRRATNNRPIPVLMGFVGQGISEFQPCRTRGQISLPDALAAVVRQPVAVRLGEDRKMMPRFSMGDMVVIDQCERERLRITPTFTYLVMTGEGPRLRHIRNSGKNLYLVAEACLHRPAEWECVSLEGKPQLEVVCGRVVWLSRQPEKDVLA